MTTKDDRESSKIVGSAVVVMISALIAMLLFTSVSFPNKTTTYIILFSASASIYVSISIAIGLFAFNVYFDKKFAKEDKNEQKESKSTQK